MFNKKTNTLADNDKQLMIRAMENIINGSFTPVDTASFTDPAYAEKLNQVIYTFLNANNNFVMRLNESMMSIGDSSIIKEMLDQVDAQNVSIQSMNDSSRNLQESLTKISDEASHIKETTLNTVKISQTSAEHMKEVITAIEGSVEEVSSINDKAQFFHDKVMEISSIIDMIKKISNQSSMLALNASIEAARAGETGKGFAVVANQMTDLSKSTSQSAETIVNYVAELRDNIGELITLVNNTTAHLDDNNTMLRRSEEDFNSMSEQMDLINDSINNIYTSVNVQSEVTELFVKSMEDIANSYATLGDNCLNTGKHMYRISRYIDTARSDMARGFSNITTQDWLRVFQVDHLIFTWRLYNNLSHFEHLNISQLNNPKGCKLGKWIAAQTDPQITGNQHFKDIMRYHEDIHKYGCDSWYAAEDGDTALAVSNFSKALESYNNFSNSMDKFKKFMATIGHTASTKITVISP